MNTVAPHVYQKIRVTLRRKLLRSLQPCQAVTALMSESLERPLSVLDRIKIRLHMVVCAWCKRYLEQITLIQAVVRRIEPTSGVDTKLSEESRQRIINQLRNE